VGGEQEAGEEGEEEVVTVAGQGVARTAAAAAAEDDLRSRAGLKITTTTTTTCTSKPRGSDLQHMTCEQSMAAARTHPVEQRRRVEEEGEDEGRRPQKLAPLGELQLQEPADKKQGSSQPAESTPSSTMEQHHAQILTQYDIY